MSAPSHLLSSPRLRLRPVTERDVTSLLEHWTEPAVRRYLWDDETIPRRQVESIVGESERSFARRGYGLWAIRRIDASDLLGCGGYWEFHEPPRLELVVSLSRRYWWQGFATEAANLLIDHAFDALGFEEVLASTDAPNAASLRLIDRLGFERTHRAESGDLDTVFYVLAKAARADAPGGASGNRRAR